MFEHLYLVYSKYKKLQISTQKNYQANLGIKKIEGNQLCKPSGK
jgi:hypothetical protein